MPEIDFKKAKVRPNPFADQIAQEGYTIQVDPRVRTEKSAFAKLRKGLRDAVEYEQGSKALVTRDIRSDNRKSRSEKVGRVRFKPKDRKRR